MIASDTTVRSLVSATHMISLNHGGIEMSGQGVACSFT
jgi:hypothetical protein